MKLIEAMKGLKLLLKRMKDNWEHIEKYASILSTEKAVFESETAQRKEVASLVQANVDLEKEYRKNKKNIDYTNLTTTVELDGKPFTIADLLIIKRTTHVPLTQTFKALNPNSATSRYNRSHLVDGKAPQVIQLFDEKEKNERMREIQDLYNRIDSFLEVVNATTDVVECPI
jgi:hypothetical protein